MSNLCIYAYIILRKTFQQTVLVTRPSQLLSAIPECPTSAQPVQRATDPEPPSRSGIRGRVQRQEGAAGDLLPLHVVPHARRHLPRRLHEDAARADG